MPTIITHAVTGFAGSKIFQFKELSKKFIALSIILPMLPDADVLGFYFGIPYNSFFGHRGFFHSITFAVILAVCVTLIFFREYKIISKRWLLLTLYFSVLISSHGIFDAMTNGGLGIALFSPFDNSRIFLPFRPIQVSPIGIQSFFSAWGLRTLFSEIIWVWMPLILLFLIVHFIRKRINSHKNI